MSEHTPGPWEMGVKCDEHSSYFDCDINIYPPKAKDGEYQYSGPIAVVAVNSDVDDANARLIAAAPEMLEALRELLTDMVIAQGNMRNAAKRDSSWEGCAEAIQPRVDAARAAIAKAKGDKV